ncbi:RNA polymerase sigma factor SigI [Cytobacillus sp. Hz8]|uniref:RNA polymerase sigma factor SigI n=1 Tax=Cytobacillus sp. Hz8 TaxID=3347168 RepID=UPI0035DD3B29
MLSLLFHTFTKKSAKSLEKQVKLIQQGDVALQDQLINSYKPFIAKNVSAVCKRYISESDDEFSIGLIAFNEAIQKYSPDKGSSLLSFAEVIIKRRVIDYIRGQSRHQINSVPAFNNEQQEEEESASFIEEELSIKEFKEKVDNTKRREEIYQFSNMLEEFGLSFQDLVEQSPKHADARKNAMIVAKTLVQDEEMKSLFMEKKKLPIKQLERKVEVSRKTIERNRKYIMAISLIVMSDFVYLKDYIKGVLET